MILLINQNWLATTTGLRIRHSVMLGRQAANTDTAICFFPCYLMGTRDHLLIKDSNGVLWFQVTVASFIVGRKCHLQPFESVMTVASPLVTDLFRLLKKQQSMEVLLVR